MRVSDVAWLTSNVAWLPYSHLFDRHFNLSLPCSSEELGSLLCKSQLFPAWAPQRCRLQSVARTPFQLSPEKPPYPRASRHFGNLAALGTSTRDEVSLIRLESHWAVFITTTAEIRRDFQCESFVGRQPAWLRYAGVRDHEVIIKFRGNPAHTGKGSFVSRLPLIPQTACQEAGSYFKRHRLLHQVSPSAGFPPSCQELR
jgi:hypothetical protein